jgi:hypothetical protein
MAMFLYLDTEFNGFGGELISLALVPADRDLPEFYAVRRIPEDVHPWVREHVLPALNESAIGAGAFQNAFWDYLLGLPPFMVIADWPEDIAHFCQQICAEGGRHLPITPFFHLVRSEPLSPEIPHNALSDARALRDWHIKR